MKNKIIKSLFTIALVITLGITNVFAADSNVTFYKRDLSGVKKQAGIANTYYKYATTSAGTVMGYCLNMGKVSPANGTQLTLTGEITTAQYLFFFEHGFNGNSYDTNFMSAGLTNDQAYYATQLAIWLYQGSITVDSLDSSNPAVKAAIQLYEASKLSGYVESYMLMAIADLNMELNSDKTLYVSKEMHMTGYGFDTYKIYVDGLVDGAKLIKADGTTIANGSTLNFKDSIYLQMDATKVTGNINMTVRSEASSNYSRVYGYTSGDANKQNIGMLLPASKNMDSKHTLNIKYENVPKGNKELIIHKQDASTKAELAGATLAIKDASGNIVQQWITDGTAHIITDLPAGDYTLVELASPEGYELGDGVINFTLVGEDYSKDIVMLNSKIPVTADMNFTLIVSAFVIFLGFGIFGLIKASKKEF